MSFLISLCEDMAALRASGAVDEDSPYRGLIDGRSGAHVQYSPDGTQSMIVLTSTDGLEALELAPYVTVTSYEEIFGYTRQVEIDGVLQWLGTDEEGNDIPLLETVAGNATLRAKYDAIYPRTPYTDDEGNQHIPPQFFAVPGGHSVEHIL